MAEREVKKWITINGRHVPIFEDDGSGFEVSQGQQEIEDSIRDSDREHLYYLDADGNEIIHAQGDINEVDFDPQLDEDNTFNRKVEQAVWNGEEIHTTHNHLQKSIFSPDDVDSFVSLENKSLTATIPSGNDVSAYRLIREQPISQGLDEQGIAHFNLDGSVTYEKDYTSELSPRLLAKDYDKAYRKVWEPMSKEMDALIRLFRFGMISKEQFDKQIAPMDSKIADEMEKWLKTNAKKYGYRFEVSR